MPAAGCALKRALWCSGLVGADARESDLGRGGTSDSGGGYTQRAGEACAIRRSPHNFMHALQSTCLYAINFKIGNS